MKAINHNMIKESNRNKIIALLLEREEITKLDISRALDISITTVSSNINELKELGIVEDVRSLESTGGRKAVSLKLKENCRFSVGIALTYRHIKVMLINIKKEIVDFIKIRHGNTDMSDIAEKMDKAVSDILEKNKIKEEKLLGIGVSIQGLVNAEEGIIEGCYFLNAKEFDLKTVFEHYNTPVFIQNEANLSAYYEFKNKGNIKTHGEENLLYISITDGLGLGIIINGEIYKGCSNSAGELGHIKVQMTNGKKCRCGQTGCLEAYTSKNVLLEDYAAETGEELNDIDEFIEKYRQKDKKAEEIFEKYLKNLSVGISNLTMIFDPAVVIIGGDINFLVEKNINRLKKFIKENNSLIIKQTSDLRVTKFKESYLSGAALLPIEEFLKIK